MRHEGVLRHRHRDKDAEREIAESERVIHTVQRNLESLTRQVPMAAVEDLPEAIQI